LQLQLRQYLLKNVFQLQWRKSMRKGIMQISLEDDQTIEDRVDPTEAEDEVRVDEATEFLDAPEPEVAEAEAAAGEVERSEAEIDEAADTAETLDDMADRVEETIPEGGLGEKEAEALEVAVEHMLARVGFSAKKRKVFPAMEGFADPATRAQKTKIAVEDMREKAKALIKAIIEAIKKAIEHVKAFFDFSGKAAAKTAARAEEMEKAAKAATGAQKRDAIKGEALLVSGGKMLAGNELVSAYKAHTEMPALKNDRIGRLKEVVDNIKKAVESDSVSETAEKFFGVSQDGKIVTNPDFTVADNQKVFESPLGISDRSLFTVVQIPGNEAGGALKFLAQLGGSKAMVGKSTGAKVPESTDVEPLDAAQAGELAALVNAHMKTYADLTHKVNEAQSAANTAANELSSLAGEGGEEKVKAAGAALRGATNVLLNGSTALRKVDIQIATAAITHIAKSLRTYGAAKENGKQEAIAA
jgi:hypothetical protein